MCMPNNQTLGIQALVQSYDDRAVDQALSALAAKFRKSTDDINKELNKIGIDKDVLNNIVKQLQALPEEVRKKTQGMSFDLFSDLINANGAEEKIDEVFNKFANKIQSFSDLRNRINNDEIIIKADYSQIDELIGKTERLIELQKELSEWQRGTSRTKKSINSDISVLESEIKSGITNLNVDAGQVGVGVGVNVDNEALTEVNKKIEETEESLKSARAEAEKYGGSLDELKKKIDTTYKNSLDKDTQKSTDAFRKSVQDYIKSGGSQKDLSNDVLDWYKMSGLNYPKNFIPLDQISSESEQAQQKIQELENALVDLYKQRESLTKGSIVGTEETGIDESKLKEQEQELNKIRESLAKTETQLDEVNKKYSEQSSIINELESKIKALEGFNDPKVIESDEYKNITTELENAKNKASELQRELEETQRTIELLSNNLNAYNTNDVVPRDNFENASRVIDNLNNKIDQLKTSLSETEQKFTSLSGEVTKLQQDNSSLNEQVSKLKEVNTAQQEQISNQSKIQTELEETKKKHEELLNTIRELENAQGKAELTIENAGNIEAFKSATKNVNYNEGINAPEGFVNFDYLEKAKQKLQETGNEYEKLIKAAVYYNQYLQKGGTEKIFNVDGKDISNELISVYTEMSNMIKQTGNISQEEAQKILRSVNSQLYSLNEEKEALEKRNKELEKSIKLQSQLDKKTSQTNVKGDEVSGDRTGRVMSREDLRQALINDQKSKPTKSTDVVDTTGVVTGQNQIQKELDETKGKIQEVGTKAKETKENLEALGKTNVNLDTQSTTFGSKDAVKSQTDLSSLSSEEQTLVRLKEAIDKVKEAINEKTEAIKTEETQMKDSVNAEISKLQELENKLTEIKTQFENGITSGLFKDADGNDVTIPGEVILSPKLSETFKTDADNLLQDVKIEKEVELKIGELNGNNQVIKDVKEQIEAANENVDLSDSYNSNQFNELLSKDFSTKGKKDATSQLREAYNEFKQYYDNLDKLNTVEGQKAAYNYYKAYEEALKQRISKTNLNRYSTDDNELDIARYYKPDLYDEEIDYSNLNDQINIAERSMKLFSEVQNELGNIKIDDNIAENVSKLAYNLNELGKIKSDLDNNVARPSFDSDLNAEYSIENTKKDYEELSETVSYFETILKSEISYAKEFGDTLTQSAKKAESAISNVNDELSKPQQQVKSDKGQAGSQDQDGKKSGVIQVPIEPLIDQTSWESEIDRILGLIGTKKIKIEPDMTSKEWNTLKNYIDNISKQVINMKFVNSDNALPSDLTDSYKNSEKYVKEFYSIEEKIAKAKEINSEKDLKQIAVLEERKKQLEELLRLEEQFRSDDRFSNIDTTSKDNSLNKLKSTLEQEYNANRQVFENSLQAQMSDIMDSAYKENEAFDNVKNLEKTNALLEEQRNTWQEIQDIRVKMEAMSVTDETRAEYDNLKAQKQILEQNLSNIEKQLSVYDSLIDKENQLKQLENITSNADTQIADGRIINVDKAYDEANKINNALNETQQKMSNLQKLGRTNIFSQAFSNAEVDIVSLNNQLKSGEITLTEYNRKVKEIQTSLSRQTNAVKLFDPGDMQQAAERMKEIAQQMPGIREETIKWGNGNKSLTATFQDQNGEWQKLTLNAQAASGVITATFTNAQKPATNFSKFLDELGSKFRNLAAYIASFVSFYEIWAQIKQGVTYVRELDTALTEMRKVSDETVTSLREFQQASFDVANSIGATAKEISNSTADFMRLGYSLQEASELAEDANIYANVGDMEIDEATEHMISSIKAWGSEFESEVEASEAIINRYNEIGNNFAISSADIGSAMERSGAALKAAGNSLNESLGLIVSGNLIQQDADVTAAALRTMSLRIRGAASELEEAGEDTEGMATSTAKLREEIKALSGVDIMLNDTTFKSTAEIIKELGAVWEDLDDITQANILEQIAGKNRASTVAGLLENYELIDEVIQSAENADGSALRENERYLDSIDGKLDQLTNSVQKFWSEAINSETVKTV